MSETPRKCYQCDDGETLAEIQARRKAEVRAWADDQIRIADAAWLGLGESSPFEVDIAEIDVQTIPEDQVVPTEEEAQARLDGDNDTAPVVDVEEAKPAPKRKTAPKS